MVVYIVYENIKFENSIPNYICDDIAKAKAYIQEQNNRCDKNGWSYSDFQIARVKINSSFTLEDCEFDTIEEKERENE